MPVERALFAKELGRLGAVFNRALDKLAIAAYYEALGELTLEELTWAVKEAVAVERFFPSPAVLLEHAKSTPRPAGIDWPAVSAAVLVMLPAEAREAYEAQRRDTGTALPPMEPSEAMELVSKIRKRSGLGRAVVEEEF